MLARRGIGVGIAVGNPVKTVAGVALACYGYESVVEDL